MSGNRREIATYRKAPTLCELGFILGAMCDEGKAYQMTFCRKIQGFPPLSTK